MIHDPSARKRYARLNERKTVLALGAQQPIQGEKLTAAYFHGSDGLSNISQTHPHFTPPELAESELHEHLELSKKHSSDVMLDILREEEEGSVVIIALGPLSNLALALRKDPKVFARVGEVVWMGGALDVPGNTSPTAEFNCYADPYAAQEILDAVSSNLFPLTMCPLDITTPHTIPFSQLIYDASNQINPPTPLREFTSAMLVRVRGLMKAFGLPDGMEMHDPLAIWYAISNPPRRDLNGGSGREGGWKTQKRVFKVERLGEFTRGMCVVDRRGTGDESFLRTKGSNANGGPELNGSGNGPAQPTDAPNVVIQTPGKEALEEMLLSRVFGTDGGR